MTVTVYRLVKRRYQNQTFPGSAGCTRTAVGHRVANRSYTSASISLAVLEYTVHYRRRGGVPASALGRGASPDSMAIETVRTTDLPAQWFTATPPAALLVIGEDWLERDATAVLKVPSAIVPEEWNYLFNPQHTDFRRIVVQPPEPFSFDRRLARTHK